MAETLSLGHSIYLVDRKSLEITKVGGILSFDEGEILIEVGDTSLVVEGEGLKVEDLSGKEGKIHITGNITGFSYLDKTIKRQKRGLFG